MEESDHTIRVLQEIRDGIHTLTSVVRDNSVRIDGVSERVDGLTTHVEGLTDAVRENSARIDLVVGGVTRLRTEVIAVRAGVDRIDARLDNVFTGPMGTLVRDHEQRLQRIETKVGLASE